MAPTFSIIMTSFNYAAYVGAAIESVLAQSFEDWELLVVDDCSTDDSWAVIQSYKDPRIKVFRHDVNAGACAAYNKALSRAQGRYIACLDSDDLFRPSKLEQQAAFFAVNPDTDICGTFVEEIDSAGSPVVGATPYADWFNVLIDLNEPAKWLWANHLCHSGAVVRAELHARLGVFDTALTYTPDWQFWLRALISESRFAVIPEPLVGYRNHGGNITHRNREGTVKEHAQTSAKVLLPWLAQQNRLDLLEMLVQGFTGNPEVIASKELQNTVARDLMSGAQALETGSAALRLLASKEVQLAELWADKNWYEGQRHEMSTQLEAAEVRLTEYSQSLAKSELLLSERDMELTKLRPHWGVRLMNVRQPAKSVDGDKGI